MARTCREAAIARDLKAMFRALEARPVPGAIRSVVDQLDGGQRPVVAARPRRLSA